MKSIIFIIPYFGSFPSYFQLWLNSCKLNPTIEWLIITDISEYYDYPQNVKIISMTFEELKIYIQAKYDFSINLPSPYKLCDFKPAYGEIFNEFISSFDYWGYCDVDLIWGNIRKFLSNDLLDKEYDKIFNWGHCTLYHNTKENNQTYKNQVDGIAYYKQVFSSPCNFFFDEFHGMTPLYAKLNKKVCDLMYSYDAKVRSYKFRPAYSMPSTYKYLHGKDGVFKKTNDGLFFFYIDKNKVFRQEFMYVHLQKRKMRNELLDSDVENYFIVPNRFITNVELTPKGIRKELPKIWYLYWDQIQ